MRPTGVARWPECCCLFAASALQHRGAPASVWLWAGAYVVLALSRLLLLARAKAERAGLDHRRGRAFRQTWLALLTVSAAIWGAGPPLFLAKDFASGGLLTGIWLAAAGLSAPLVAAARPAIYLWLLPALVPLLFALALYGSGEALVLAVLGSVFLLVLLRLVLEQNESLAAGLAARFQNEDLVEQLRTQVEVAARANQEKTRFLASAVHDLRQPLHALGLFCAALEQRLQNIPERPFDQEHDGLDRSAGDLVRRNAGHIPPGRRHRSCVPAVVSGAGRFPAPVPAIRRRCRSERHLAAIPRGAPGRAERSATARAGACQSGAERAAIHAPRRGSGGGTAARTRRGARSVGHRRRYPGPNSSS